MTDSYQIQKNQFEKISKNYDTVYEDVIAATHRLSQERYYGRCEGKRVLDIGNGGQPAESVLGPISKTLSNFVGIDYSLAMMQKTKLDFQKAVGDALKLPFKDNSFDYVTVNGLLHHLGYESPEANKRRIQQFIHEALRVCTDEVIIYEVCVSPLLEKLERAVARFKYMPTFVLSEKTLDEYLGDMGLARGENVTRSFAQLTRPWYPMAYVMDYTWLKLPAFVSITHAVFFVLRKPSKLKD